MSANARLQRLRTFSAARSIAACFAASGLLDADERRVLEAVDRLTAQPARLLLGRALAHRALDEVVPLLVLDDLLRGDPLVLAAQRR